jgi:hypothetical protein
MSKILLERYILESLNRLPRFIGMDGDQSMYSFDGSHDVYLHYASRENADKIKKSNMLETAGVDYSAFAISLKYGRYVPSVQRGRVCGLRGVEECDIVGILFRTDDQPKIGFPEEVTFRGGAKIKDVKIIEGEELRSVESGLNGMSGLDEDSDYYVLYDYVDSK